MKQLIQDAATILVSIHDEKGPLGVVGQAICSHLYLLVCKGDLHRFNMAKGLLIDKGWATATSDLVTLTKEGIAKGAELKAMLEEVA